MSDPYFQTLFADRIGGAQYGKGTAIYKFEKIKRAKRQALAEHPERQAARLRHRRERRRGRRAWSAAAMAEEIGKPENRGYADNGVAGVQGSRRPLHAARVRRRARPGDAR